MTSPSGTDRGKSTELPGFLRHLQLEAPGGPVLVPAESADELRVDLPAGRIVSRVGVGDFPHDATATEAGTVLVANEFGGTLSVCAMATAPPMPSPIVEGSSS